MKPRRLKGGIAAAACVGVLAAFATAMIATHGSGAVAHTSGGPLVSYSSETRAVYNGQAQPLLAESLSMQNSGKQPLVLDRVRLDGPTPGLHLERAYLAWHLWKSSLSPETGPGDFSAAGRNKRPRWAGTTVPPRRWFSVELLLHFTGQSERWTYRSLDIDYHVGQAKYRQRYDAMSRYVVCRTHTCVNSTLGLTTAPSG